MIIAVVGIALIGLVLGLWFARHQARYRRRVDAAVAGLCQQPAAQSRTLGLAIDELEQAVHAETGETHDGKLANQRYRGALGSITLGVVVVDAAGEIQYANPSGSAFLDARHGEALVGSAIDELSSIALTGSADDKEVQIFGPPRRTLFVSAHPIRENQLDLGAVVLIDDITEQERVDAVRRDFVANISHELRTPIGAISLLAETLREEPDRDVVDRLSGRLSSEAERLAHTVDDLLELSRIEYGAGEDLGPVVLQQVVDAAHARVREAAVQRGVDIGINLPNRELVMEGSEVQLTSAVYNLLENAVKYIGDDGGPVSVRGRELGDRIELVIQDSGIGVPRKDLDRIFERFYRVDRGRSRESGGTGLGLAIVRHVVANHGGRIRAESLEGEGTTFTIVLPVVSSGWGLSPSTPTETETLAEGEVDSGGRGAIRHD